MNEQQRIEATVNDVVDPDVFMDRLGFCNLAAAQAIVRDHRSRAGEELSADEHALVRAYRDLVAAWERVGGYEARGPESVPGWVRVA